VTTRRTLLAGTGAALLTSPFRALAQPAARPARIGFLGLDKAADPRPREAVLQGLRELGYVEGGNLTIEQRYAQGQPEQFPALAAELAALKVDVIVSFGGTLGALAAMRATKTIPIVFPAAGDPVGEGLVASLARPGGNVTGLSTFSTELIGKSLELLKQAAPGADRIALLLKPDSIPERAKKERLKTAHVVARALGAWLQVVEAHGPEDFDRAFGDMAKARAGALAVWATPVFDNARPRLLDRVARNRLPAMYSYRSYVEAGGLMCYGPDLLDLFRRSATYVDKILKGAKPGDLPVEQPTKFELLINLKTARALELPIPKALLGRADEVIE